MPTRWPPSCASSASRSTPPRSRHARLAGKPVGRPHLAAAVVDHPANAERLEAEGLTDVSSFIPAYLIQGTSGYVARSYPTVAEAITWIHEAGGVAVWAHPFWDIEDEQQVLAAIDRYRAEGLDGVEVYYTTHTPEQTALLADRCGELGLLTTGSADFHGPEHRLFSSFRAFDLQGRTPELGPINAGVSGSSVSNGHRPGLCLWLTGLSGAGKSTIARAVERELREQGHRVEVLDGDVVRRNLTVGLGYSRRDRDVNVGRIAFVADLLSRNGVVVIVAAISPYRDARDRARQLMRGRFAEVYVRATVDECERRDVKGLYKRARDGDIDQFTGVSDPYEAPESPEMVVDTEGESPSESAAKVAALVEQRLGLQLV